MKKTYTLNADGSLLVVAEDDKQDDLGNRLTTRWTIGAEQIAAHRRDPDFERELPAKIKRNIASLEKARADLPAAK
jgi:hypothetical protein